MKIAFIGTHGVGKTTLCYELAARLKRLDYSVDIVREVARDCPLPINKETTLSAQTWILHTQIAAETAAESRNDVVICDRSVLDNYAYLVHKLGPRLELEPLIAAWIPGYRALIKVPLWRSPRFDGLRDTGVDFQVGIDRTLNELIHRLGAPVTHLQGEDPSDWPNQVVDYLDLPPRPEQVDLFPKAAPEA